MHGTGRDLRLGFKVTEDLQSLRAEISFEFGLEIEALGLVGSELDVLLLHWQNWSPSL